MSPRRFAFATLLGALLALAACGGDGNSGGDAGVLSLDDYFRRIDAIQKDADDRFDEQDQLTGPDAGASEAELAAFVRDVLNESAAILQDAAGEGAALAPPSEVLALHNGFIAAIGDAALAVRDIRDSIPNTLSHEQLQNFEGLFSSAALAEAFDRLEEACLGLEDVAGDNDVELDLDCGE